MLMLSDLSGDERGDPLCQDRSDGGRGGGAQAGGGATQEEGQEESRAEEAQVTAQASQGCPGSPWVSLGAP